MNNDLISRKALIKWIDDSVSQYGHTYSTDMLNMWGLFKDYLINNAPTAEITEEQAIDKLHETGWLIRHDKEMTERPHIIDNCDMNVFEPEKHMKERPKEEKLYEIKVNIPEDIKDKLIEELSKPRKVIPDESKTVTDCMIAYGDGFESARRLFESKCRDCDFRKFSETFINGIVEVMTKNGIESVEQLTEILGKGNDND